MIESCTFCRIVRGELPAVLLDEGRHSVVFLDRNQAARGHVLVVAKEHRETWDALDEQVAVEMALLARRWARVLRAALGVDAYNLLMNNGRAAGQDVMHAHFHVTPRVDGDGYYSFSGRVAVLDEDAKRELEAKLLAAKP